MYRLASSYSRRRFYEEGTPPKVSSITTFSGFVIENEVLNEFALFERCREQTARSHAYRTRFKLRHHLDIGQKVLSENHRQDLTKRQKLQQRRLGPFTVTKRKTSTIYQIQDNKDPSMMQKVHRNNLVEYYPK